MPSVTHSSHFSLMKDSSVLNEETKSSLPACKRERESAILMHETLRVHPSEHRLSLPERKNEIKLKSKNKYKREKKQRQRRKKKTFQYSY